MYSWTTLPGLAAVWVNVGQSLYLSALNPVLTGIPTASRLEKKEWKLALNPHWINRLKGKYPIPMYPNHLLILFTRFCLRMETHATHASMNTVETLLGNFFNFFLFSPSPSFYWKFPNSLRVKRRPLCLCQWHTFRGWGWCVSISPLYSASIQHTAPPQAVLKKEPGHF